MSETTQALAAENNEEKWNDLRICIKSVKGEKFWLQSVSSGILVGAIRSTLASDHAMAFTTNYDLKLVAADGKGVYLHDFSRLAEYEVENESTFEMVKRDYDLSSVKEHLRRVRLALKTGTSSSDQIAEKDDGANMSMTMERILKIRKLVDDVATWPPTWLGTQYPVFHSTSCATLKAKLKMPSKFTPASDYITCIAFDPNSNPPSQSEQLFLGKIAVIRIEFNQHFLPNQHPMMVVAFRKGFRLLSKPDAPLQYDLMDLVFAQYPQIKQALYLPPARGCSDCMRLKWVSTVRHATNAEACQNWLKSDDGLQEVFYNRDWNEDFQKSCEEGDMAKAYIICEQFKQHCEKDLMSKILNGECLSLVQYVEATDQFDDLFIFGKIFVSKIAEEFSERSEGNGTCAKNRLQRIDQFICDVENNNCLLDNGAFFKVSEDDTGRIGCVLSAVICYQNQAYQFQALVPGAVQMAETNTKKARLLYGFVDGHQKLVVKKRGFDAIKSRIAPLFHWKETRISRHPTGVSEAERPENEENTIDVDFEDEVDADDEEYTRHYGPFELKCLESREDGRIYLIDNMRAFPHICVDEDRRDRCTTFSIINAIQLSAVVVERDGEAAIDAIKIYVDVNEGLGVNAAVQPVVEEEEEGCHDCRDANHHHNDNNDGDGETRIKPQRPRVQHAGWKEFDAKVRAEIEVVPLEQLIAVGQILDGKSLALVLESYGINIEVYASALRTKFAANALISTLLEIELVARSARDVFIGLTKLEDAKTDAGVAVTHSLQVVRRFCQLTKVVLKKDGVDAYTIWDLLEGLQSNVDQAMSWVSSIGYITKSICPLHPSEIGWNLLLQAEDLLVSFDQEATAYAASRFNNNNENDGGGGDNNDDEINVEGLDDGRRRRTELYQQSSRLFCLMQKVLSLMEEVNTCHADLARCLQTMGRFGLIVGDLDMAILCTQRAYSCIEELEGSDCVQAVHLLDDLSSLYLQAAKTRQSEEMLINAIGSLNFAIDIADVMFGISHPYVAHLVAKLADVYDTVVNDWDRALVCYDCVASNSTNIEENLRCRYATASIHAMVAVSTIGEFTEAQKNKLSETATQSSSSSSDDGGKSGTDYNQVRIQLMLQDAMTKMRDVYSGYKAAYGEKSQLSLDVLKRLEWLTRCFVDLSNQTGTVVKRVPPSLRDDKRSKYPLQVFKLTKPTSPTISSGGSSPSIEIDSPTNHDTTQRIMRLGMDEDVEIVSGGVHAVKANDGDDDDDDVVVGKAKSSNRKNGNSKKKKTKARRR